MCPQNVADTVRVRDCGRKWHQLNAASVPGIKVRGRQAVRESSRQEWTDGVGQGGIKGFATSGLDRPHVGNGSFGRMSIIKQESLSNNPRVVVEHRTVCGDARRMTAIEARIVSLGPCRVRARQDHMGDSIGTRLCTNLFRKLGGGTEVGYAVLRHPASEIRDRAAQRESCRPQWEAPSLRRSLPRRPGIPGAGQPDVPRGVVEPGSVGTRLRKRASGEGGNPSASVFVTNFDIRAPE